MKKQAILAAMLAALSGASFAASPNDFQLTYTGEVVHTGCILDAGSSAVNLVIPDKNLAEINSSGARVYAPFSLKLLNCGPNQMVHGKFATSHTLHAAKNKFKATGTANDVGMIVRYTLPSTGVKTAAMFDGSVVNIAQNKTAVAADVTVDMDMLVTYFQTIGTATAGTASGAASLTLSY